MTRQWHDQFLSSFHPLSRDPPLRLAQTNVSPLGGAQFSRTYESQWREAQRQAGDQAPLVAIDSSQELADACWINDAGEMPTLRRWQGSAQIRRGIPLRTGGCYCIPEDLPAGLKASVRSIKRSARLDTSDRL